MATSTAAFNRCGTFLSLRLDRRRVLLTGPEEMCWTAGAPVFRTK
jgi:hypothetical protein